MPKLKHAASVPRRGLKERPKEKGKKRGNGKVARLPQKARAKVSQMIADGVEYGEIIKRMGRRGKGLTEQNLYNWKTWGYKDWVRQQERLDYMRAMREFAKEVTREFKGNQMQEAGLQLAATQVYELLMDFEPKSLKAKLKGNPENYARIVNVLSRLSDDGLKFERYREEVAQRKAAIQTEIARSKQNGITAETLSRIEEELNLL
jgi:hypothetical protein